MDQLKVQVGKMHELDRHCVLLLDEISLSSGLHYEPHKGHISGYEDLGHLGRSEKLQTTHWCFWLEALERIGNRLLHIISLRKQFPLYALKARNFVIEHLLQIDL
ncbi:hypothetical protein HHI36_019535, partial [Cryptolaemus montrouzieri]